MAAQGWATTAVEYLNRSLDDAEVRKNLARGAESIRQASRQIAGRRPATKAAKKKTLQRKLRDAVFSLGRTGAAAREAEKKRERSRRRRRLLLVLAGASLAAGLSGPGRNRARRLFGGQDEVSEPPLASPPPQAQQTPVEPVEEN
jgi:hypothetical protein